MANNNNNVVFGVIIGVIGVVIVVAFHAAIHAIIGVVIVIAMCAVIGVCRSRYSVMDVVPSGGDGDVQTTQMAIQMTG